MCYRNTSYGETTFDRYFFEKDLFGNIVAVYSETGTKVASYCYDAWGNCTVLTNTNGIGAMNPFRYRGYYLDTEINLYYLQSRYYDSYVGRFINADDVSTVTASMDALTDKNLFSYCDNNPVMRTDEDGEFWNYIIGGVIGAVAGGLVAAISSYKETGSVNVQKVLIGAAGGAISGVIAASGLGILAQAALSATVSGVSDVANQIVDISQNGGSFADYNLAQTVIEAGLGGITSAVGSVAGSFIGKHVTHTAEIADTAFDGYLSKTFSARMKAEAGRSTSGLLKQANRYLAKSVLYDNISRGVSSAVGSMISLWNLAR